jgi:hypothetical protein
MPVGSPHFKFKENVSKDFGHNTSSSGLYEPITARKENQSPSQKGSHIVEFQGINSIGIELLSSESPAKALISNRESLSNLWQRLNLEQTPGPSPRLIIPKTQVSLDSNSNYIL